MEGLAYRLVPIKTKNRDGQTGRVATDIMYDNVMNKFKWGGMDKDVYMNETNMRMTYNIRNNFARLSDALLKEGKVDSAVKVLDRCLEVLPDKSIPYNFFMTPIADGYYRAGLPEKGTVIIKRLAEIYEDDLDYYLSLEGDYATSVSQDTQRALSIMQRLIQMARNYQQTELLEELKGTFELQQQRYAQWQIKS